MMILIMHLQFKIILIIMCLKWQKYCHYHKLMSIMVLMIINVMQRIPNQQAAFTATLTVYVSEIK